MNARWALCHWAVYQLSLYFFFFKSFTDVPKLALSSLYVIQIGLDLPVSTFWVAGIKGLCYQVCSHCFFQMKCIHKKNLTEECPRIYIFMGFIYQEAKEYLKILSYHFYWSEEVVWLAETFLNGKNESSPFCVGVGMIQARYHFSSL